MNKEMICVYVVELSDNEIQLWTEAELRKAEKDAEEFDGFYGWTEICKGYINIGNLIGLCVKM